MYSVFNKSVLTLLLLGMMDVRDCEAGNLSDVVHSAFPDVSAFEVPAEASLLANFIFDVRGGKVPCLSLVNGRRCMNVSQTVPVMEGR